MRRRPCEAFATAPPSGSSRWRRRTRSSSTRRFCCRPAAVSLVATGRPSPTPNVTIARRRNPLIDKIRADRLGAPFREPLVVFVRADAVGVALDLEAESRMRDEDARHPRQLLPRAGLQVRACRIEQHVGQIDDQSARCLSRFENHVQLCAKLLPQLGLLLLGLPLRSGALVPAPLRRAAPPQPARVPPRPRCAPPRQSAARGFRFGLRPLGRACWAWAACGSAPRASACPLRLGRARCGRLRIELGLATTSCLGLSAILRLPLASLRGRALLGLELLFLPLQARPDERPPPSAPPGVPAS